MNRISTVLRVIVVACGALAAGCAANDQQPAVRGPGKDLAKQWAQAAKQPPEVDKATSAPEPKLLPMTHFSAGNLLEKQNNCLGAIEQYRKAVELNTTFAAAYGRLGLCYIKVGQYDLAIQTLKRAADLQPTAAQVWNNLGFAYMARQNYRQAEECLGKALMAKPGFARARLNMAITLVQLNRDPEALGHLLAIHPESVAQYDLGTLQLAAGRPADARASFERALSLQSDLAAARKGLDESLARLVNVPPAPTPAVPLADHASAAATPAAPAAGQPAASAAPAAQPVASATSDVAEPAATAPRDAKTDVSEPLLAKSSPATRPIVGIDDEPALANASAGFVPCEPDGFIQIVPVFVDLPTVESLACVRPVVFTDDAGQSLRWPFDVSCGPDVAMSDAALAQALVCFMTSRQVETSDSVADLDLASLRWAAWTDAIASLDDDVTALSNEDLRTVLSKWLCALNELESVMPAEYGATVFADDVLP